MLRSLVSLAKRAYVEGVSAASSARRVIQAVAQSPVSEKVADAQGTLYRPVLARVRRSVFHTDVLGHSMHPMLTDVTIGCWLSASVLDVFGGSAARGSARLLVAAGVASAVPTSPAGAADWTDLSGTDRSIGAVHAAGTDVATFLFLGSLIARVRGHDARGSKLALAGNTVMVGAGFLGGHLALARGAARRAPAAS